MKKLWVAIGVALALFPGCNPDGKVKDYTLSVKAKKLPAGEVLLSKGKDSYFYDLKITDSYYLFADDKGDTVVWVYDRNEPVCLVGSVCRKFGEAGVWAPKFRKEVQVEKDEDVVWAIDDDQYERQFLLQPDSIEVRTTFLPKSVIHSMDYNRTGKELYGVPLNRTKYYPFYYYNSTDGYYWVDPAPAVSAALTSFHADAFASALCVHENIGSAVTAYRFTNFLTFYDLAGTPNTTVKIGDAVVAPSLLPERDILDVDKSMKCFTYVYGTPSHVYCVYDGSTDFSNSSKILVFDWNGKHVVTWQADRNLRAIAVNQKDDFLLAVSALEEGGQDIVRYSLSKE